MKIYTITGGAAKTNTYFICNDKNECIIIDPSDNETGVLDTLKIKNLLPKYVLLTHAHFDHCNSCARLQKEGAKVFMHEKDVVLIASDKNLAKPFGVKFNEFKPDGFVSDGQKLELLGLKFSVLYTSGHTPGGVCYIMGKIMFSGDTLFKMSIGRTDFPFANPADMRKSLKKIFGLRGDYAVMCGHGPTTTLDFERKNNPYA